MCSICFDVQAINSSFDSEYDSGCGQFWVFEAAGEMRRTLCILHAYFGILVLVSVPRSRGALTASLWDAETGKVISRAKIAPSSFHFCSWDIWFDTQEPRLVWRWDMLATSGTSEFILSKQQEKASKSRLPSMTFHFWQGTCFSKVNLVNLEMFQKSGLKKKHKMESPSEVLSVKNKTVQYIPPKLCSQPTLSCFITKQKVIKKTEWARYTIMEQ